MSLDDWHLVFVSLCLVLVMATSVPLVISYLPRRDEPFFALAVLGEDGMAEDYYHRDDQNIKVGDEVHWTLYLYNHMGEVEYVAIRVKLINSTMSAPESNTGTPSLAPVVYEVRRIMLDNEIWLYPFNWVLMEVSEERDLVSIEGLMINGRIFKTFVNAVYGGNFRMVIELWVYDEASENFIFGWISGPESNYDWNQIWFNVTSDG